MDENNKNNNILDNSNNNIDNSENNQSIKSIIFTNKSNNINLNNNEDLIESSENNIENIEFNNNNENININNFFSEKRDVVIEENIAIQEKNLIYKDDNIYLTELENQLLSEYPVQRQDSIYIQQKVLEESKKIITIKNDGLYKFNLIKNNIEYDLINDIIKNNYSHNNVIIPIVLDKHRIYIKLKEEEQEKKDTKVKKTKDKDIDEEIYKKDSVNIINNIESFFYESNEDQNGIFSDNQIVQMSELKKIEHQYNISAITFKEYLSKVYNLTKSYNIDFSELNSYQIKPTDNCLVLRYNDLDNINWNTYKTASDINYSKNIIDERGSIKGIEKDTLLETDNINVRGFLVFGTERNNIEKQFINIGKIDKIYSLKNLIIVEIKNHGLLKDDIICIENSNCFPSINNIYKKNIEIIDKNSFSLNIPNFIIKKEGNDGQLSILSKLYFDLYNISTDNKNNINIEFKQSNYLSEKEEKTNHNKIYLFNNINFSNPEIYKNIIKKVLPTLSEIFNKQETNLNSVYNYNDFNNLFKKYNLTVNDFTINENIILKKKFEKNIEKINVFYRKLEKKHNNYKYNFNKKENTKYFNQSEYFLSNNFITAESIKKIYGEYLHLNKIEDNLFLRLKWIENQNDQGNTYYNKLIINNYKKLKEDIKNNELTNKINILKDKLKILEKNKSETNIKLEKNCLYKYYPIIIKNKEKDIKDKKLEDGSIVFYEDNIYILKKNEFVELNNQNENTMAVIENNIWIWKKNKWEKSDKSAKYNNIKYICEFHNLDIKDIQLDNFDCIYRKDIGCNSKIYLRLEEHINSVKENIDKLKKLEDYLKNNNYIKNISSKIENLEKNKKEKSKNENKRDRLLEDTNKDTNKDKITKETLFSQLLRLIYKLDNYTNKINFIYDIIEKDGIVINEELYSKKYKISMGICGHFVYMKNIDQTENINEKIQINDKLLQLYSDNGLSEKNKNTCKKCGEVLVTVEYDETEGFNEAGMLKMSREIWNASSVELEKIDKKNLTEYLKSSKQELDCNHEQFKLMLLNYGLNSNDIEESIQICNFIKDLSNKSGIVLSNIELLNIIIDSIQKIKNIVPYYIFKSKELKKYQEKGFDQNNLEKIESKKIIEEAYNRYYTILKNSIITARFLISIQTTIPEVLRESSLAGCSFNSFYGTDGIEFFACILERMNVIVLKDKTKLFDVYKTNIENSYNNFKTLIYIQKLFLDKKKYDKELEKRKDYFKFSNKLNILETDNEITEKDENVEKELDSISKTFENKIKNIKTIEDIKKFKKELYNKEHYLSNKIKNIIKKVIATNQTSNIYLQSPVEGSCCTELAEKFINYYFYIQLESNDILRNIIEESKKLGDYEKYFIENGSIHNFILYDKNKFDGITNPIIADTYNPSNNLIKSIFETYVDSGKYEGTLREYVGSIDNLIDIKSGLTKKSILEKNYTKEEYDKLLKNIENHNIRYYHNIKIEELKKEELQDLKKISDEKLYKEINNLTLNLKKILNIDSEDAEKYNNLLKSFTKKNFNPSKLHTKNNMYNNTIKIQQNILFYQNYFNYIKKFYINKFKKYLSIIKYNKNKKEDNIKLNFIDKDDVLLEIQNEIYEENKKLDPFLKDDIREYFKNLNVSYTNTEINSIYGTNNIYQNNYEKIKKYSDFDFSDALNVVLYILISDFNKLLLHYLCKDDSTERDLQEKKEIKKLASKEVDQINFKSDSIYSIEIKNKKCKYIAEFIRVMLNILEQDKKMLDNCEPEKVKIENNMLHDIIEFKIKIYNKDDDDDYFTKMLKNKLDKVVITVDTVNEELEIEQQNINNDTYVEDIEEVIYEKGRKKIFEKYGYEASDQELEDFKEEYVENMHNSKHYKDDAYDLFSTVKGEDVVDQGAGYGEFNEFDFETGDGFDYSEE
jgi:peptidyl-tRNA hydrolase